MATILAVEDEIYIAKTLSIALTLAGHAVTVANDGAHALEILPTVQPNLIISDIMMPVLDGVSLCHRLNESPEFKHIPIVMTSAAVNKRLLEGCTIAGFLPKPFSIDGLYDTVNRALATT